MLLKTLLSKGWTQLPDSKNSTYISVDGKLQEMKSNILFIGRHNGCDILLPIDELGVSRLNAVVIVAQDPNGEQNFIVIDFWSVSGTSISLLKTPGSQQFSGPNKRSLLVLRSVPGAAIHVLNHIIRFNVRECLICFERPRTRRYNCGHSVACGVCITRKCPLCRKHVDDINFTNGFVTNG
jgi:hypothetical protein